MEWTINRQAALEAEAISGSLRHGAKIEPGPLYFDDELKMVRHHKQPAAVAQPEPPAEDVG